ncbi:MAG: KamA family radical SAM protein [Fibrobacter sp.]|nr:KamA family radical SAM protein [Fibrobacter sp.]
MPYFTRLADLWEFLKLPQDTIPEKNAFPFLVSRHFAGKMEKGNRQDPLLLQVLPQVREAIPAEGFSEDPVGDFAARADSGILQKYEGRALLVTHSACSLHCRFCFRRNYLHSNARISLEKLNRFLSENPDIRELILSGGEPFLLDPVFFESLIQTILAHPQIQTIRIHSRIPVTRPEVLPDYALSLEQIPKRIRGVLVSHVNHPNELDAASASALRDFRNLGFTLLNQSVLLKGVNDSPEILISLSEKLFSQQVLPYYLHQLDHAQGTAHFETENSRALQIHETLRKKLPGYLVPKLVREIAGKPFKMPLV